MKMIIPRNKKELLKNITENIDTRYADSSATVLINKKERSLTLVTGQKPLFAHCVFILDKRSTNLKDTTFSIDGSYAKQLPYYFASNQDIELGFQTSSTNSSFIELFQIGLKDNQATLRRCECSDTFKEHLTYLEDNKKLPTTIVSKSVIERIVFESTEHMPFELCELDKKHQRIRVQRDGKVEDKHLPNDIELPISMVMTPEITKQLTDLCYSTNSNEIEIAQQGELLIFKVNEGSVTSSVAGLNEFHTKTPEKTQTLQYAELDFHAFKKELRHCFIAYGVIKKANDAMLYLSNEEAAIAVFTGPYKFVYRVTVSKVSSEKSNNGSLYRFSPRDLLSIKIKDLIGATSTRLEIIKYQNGELKLGVYYSLEDKLPYRSIAIEKNESELPSVLAMLESFNKNQGNTQHEKQEVQEDLFAFYADEGEEY
tara:strand:- start:282 stop:1562 length:1281 start_codon:yes stop_codon:yes gene_type:complete